jgi:hypothetical protein
LLATRGVNVAGFIGMARLGGTYDLGAEKVIAKIDGN